MKSEILLYGLCVFIILFGCSKTTSPSEEVFIINVPENFSTIQEALNNAQENCIIEVEAGIYSENIIWPNIRGIKLVGAGIVDCIIDGDSLNSCIRIIHNNSLIDTTTIISGFTIRNGYSHQDYPFNSGGGIYINNSGVKVENINIQDNAASFGAGICCENNSILLLINSFVNQNISTVGMGGGGGIYLENSYLEVRNSFITENIAFHNDGGGIYAVESNLFISETTIENNECVTTPGGGIYLYQSTLTLSQSILDGNSAGDGGGLYCIHNSEANLTDVMISNNNGSYGGGIRSTSSELSLLNCVIINNYAIGSGGGINSFLGGNCEIESSKIINNSSGDFGGGISCTNGDISFVNTLISNNSTGLYGGGLYFGLASLDIVNTTITENEAETGGGVFCNDVNFYMINSILYNNLNQELFSPDHDNSSSINIAFSDVEDGANGIIIEGNASIDNYLNNINENPLFENPSNQYYQIQTISPCNGVGIESIEINNVLFTSPEFDIEGNQRPYPTQSNPDIGAYEI